jgi:hypothetical protein
MKIKLVKLKNLYTGDVVFTESYDKVKESAGTKFIEVYNPSNPYRKFLANRDAYTILKDK